MGNKDSKQAERRKRYQGTCEMCGNPTDGSNGKAKAPRHCRDCYQSTPEWKEWHTYWTAGLLLTRIRKWKDLHGAPPVSADWDPYMARHSYGDNTRAERFEDSEGYWPCRTTVVRVFGSWNAAIIAAGFTPHPVGRPTENIDRRSRRNG